MPLARALLSCSALLACGGAIAACGSAGAGAGGPAASAASHAQAAAHGAGDSGKAPTGKCAYEHAPAPKGVERLSKPTLKLDPGRRYTVTLDTNCGAIAIDLDVQDAPLTTASFAYLVKHGFYDELTFHRVASGFVIQGGDPNGDGSGGPGYTIVEPPPADMRYTLGTVAMAKTGTDPAGASGSQFFIVTARETPLPPQYALVGHVVEGMSTVQAISSLPTDPPQDGAPKTPVVIAHAALSVQ